MNSLSILQPRRLARFVAADAASVARDPMLLFATLMSVATPGLLWLFRESVDRLAASAIGFGGLSQLLVPVVLLIPAVLIGWVSGFLLLEDRDDGLLVAFDVTPVGKSGLLAYRLTIAALLTAAVTLVATQLLLPAATVWLRFLLVALVALDAAIVAATLLAVARNKVEGLAVAKLLNLAAVAPLAAAIPSEARFAFGVVPTYWIGELLGIPSQTVAPLPLLALIAMALHVLVVLYLVALVRRRVG
jgi:fluoroquinolone transport system permease protein